VNTLDEKKLRLMKLIEHWAEHNDEHSQRYNESAAEAEDLGLTGVAEEMREAHLKAAEVSMYLRSALTKIKESGGRNV
jgi:hypothetical protein